VDRKKSVRNAIEAMRIDQPSTDEFVIDFQKAREDRLVSQQEETPVKTENTADSRLF
jgi:hypothetical protein